MLAPIQAHAHVQPAAMHMHGCSLAHFPHDLVGREKVSHLDATRSSFHEGPPLRFTGVVWTGSLGSRAPVAVAYSAGLVAVCWLTAKLFAISLACLCHQPWLMAKYLIPVVLVAYK